MQHFEEVKLSEDELILVLIHIRACDVYGHGWVTLRDLVLAFGGRILRVRVPPSQSQANPYSKSVVIGQIAAESMSCRIMAVSRGITRLLLDACWVFFAVCSEAKTAGE